MAKLSLRGHDVFLTDQVKNYAQKKMDKLGQKYSFIIDIDMFLEEDHNKTEDTAAVAAATIRIPGNDVNGRASERTIFAAIDKLEEKLDKQLKKEKGLYHDPTSSRFARSKNLIRRLFGRE